MTSREVADVFGVDVNAIAAAARRGWLPGFKTLGRYRGRGEGQWRFERSVVREALAAGLTERVQ